ncbi:hypothetical protein L1987_09675 [Smallanthus sonchifolius]|uniref:Uncharacterized protein n=1 Tax=Smallanthus sonchifolius TaxID=185202 RepID=A0ACB9JQ99_9ASTR|nr:hypothetical protein L1987_09675 [Smallanthus sonchifolius]
MRFLLLPLVNLLFPYSKYISVIFTSFILFVSIKIPVRLQLSVGCMVHFQAINLSVSVMLCFLCLIFMPSRHFWIVHPIILLFLSYWDELLFKIVKLCFWWLHRALEAIPIVEFLGIFNRHGEEAQVANQQEEFSGEPYDEEAQVDQQ